MLPSNLLDDVQLPAYYLVHRELGKDYIDAILESLRIAPILCSVIYDLADATLALSICTEVIRAKDEQEAHEYALSIWRETRRPVLLIGTTGVLNAIYEDGTIEEVVKPC